MFFQTHSYPWSHEVAQSRLDKPGCSISLFAQRSWDINHYLCVQLCSIFPEDALCTRDRTGQWAEVRRPGLKSLGLEFHESGMPRL